MGRSFEMEDIYGGGGGRGQMNQQFGQMNQYPPHQQFNQHPNNQFGQPQFQVKFEFPTFFWRNSLFFESIFVRNEWHTFTSLQ